MKLRNKKTGGIWNIPKMRSPTIQEDDISFFAYNRDGGRLFSYKSIAELNDEWEDYKPVEPLIEDQKARNVFREWADLLGAKRFRVDHLCKFGGTVITSTDLLSDPAIEIPGYIGKDEETYTKEELVGEDIE